GLSFMVDGTNYTGSQNFAWAPGSKHMISSSSPQNGGPGIQYEWSAWSDGGDIGHTVMPLNSSTYTANFTTNFYLTMQAGPGGGASPSSLWTNSGEMVNLVATPNAGCLFSNWLGSGAGSYSGNSNEATVTMDGPITETASFIPIIVSVNLDGASNLAITYATAPGATSYLQTTTNLAPANWTMVVGSTTNAAGSSVTCMVPVQSNDQQRFFRIVFP
ncbi:MAG TPA: hypothetical protein VGV18_08640, partial [Verrucomicrobiae bacterium]|nr:hypothetical protein [Verrucomicrobiae bacterium]